MNDLEFFPFDLLLDPNLLEIATSLLPSMVNTGYELCSMFNEQVSFSPVLSHQSNTTKALRNSTGHVGLLSPCSCTAWETLLAVQA